jgi:quercetin dioxygenase-like cupin family protein
MSTSLAMKIIHCEQMPTAPVTTEGAVGCKMCCLIGPDDRAPSFSMRQFEIAPGGYTPRHTHAHEHEVFVLEGTGAVWDGTGERPLRAGAAVFVPPRQEHQFRNPGTGTLRFLCLIPHPIRGGSSDTCLVACGCE